MTGRGGGQCLVVQGGDDRVERGVEQFDPFDGPLHEFGAGDLAAAHEVGLGHRVQRGDLDGRVGHGHVVTW